MAVADLDSGRSNQKHRTREGLLRAARELTEEGLTPTIDALVDRARVSRATLYRYFDSADQLVAEATLEAGALVAPQVLDGVESLADRVAAVVDHIADVMLAQEVGVHATTKTFAEQWLEHPSERGRTRPGRRLAVLDAALAPHRDRLGARRADGLRAALALTIGLEAVVTAREVLGLSPDDTRTHLVDVARRLVASFESDEP